MRWRRAHMRFKLPSYNNTSTPPIDILSSTNTTYRWNHGGLLARYRPCVLTFIRRSSQQCVRSLFLLLLQSSTSAAPLGNVCLSSPRQSRSALHKLGSKASRKKGIPPTSTTAAALNSWQVRFHPRPSPSSSRSNANVGVSCSCYDCGSGVSSLACILSSRSSSTTVLWASFNTHNEGTAA